MPRLPLPVQPWPVRNADASPLCTNAHKSVRTRRFLGLDRSLGIQKSVFLRTLRTGEGGIRVEHLFVTFAFSNTCSTRPCTLISYTLLAIMDHYRPVTALEVSTRDRSGTNCRLSHSPPTMTSPTADGTRTRPASHSRPALDLPGWVRRLPHCTPPAGWHLCPLLEEGPALRLRTRSACARSGPRPTASRSAMSTSSSIEASPAAAPARWPGTTASGRPNRPGRRGSRFPYEPLTPKGLSKPSVRRGADSRAA